MSFVIRFDPECAGTSLVWASEQLLVISNVMVLEAEERWQVTRRRLGPRNLMIPVVSTLVHWTEEATFAAVLEDIFQSIGHCLETIP